MPDVFTYRTGAERPSLTLPWQEQLTATTWGDLDLSTGYTFTLELVDDAGTAQLTKTSGITGQDGSVVVTWAVGELALTVGDYALHLRANETATNADRDYSPDEPVTVRIVA